MMMHGLANFKLIYAVKLVIQFNNTTAYLRLNKELHQISYERSVGQPFLASLRSNTRDRLFIWHEQTFIQEFASRLGNSAVR
jgi:hypothetical protein